MRKRDFIKAGLVCIAGLASVRLDGKRVLHEDIAKSFSLPKYSYHVTRTANVFTKDSFSLYLQQLAETNRKLILELNNTVFFPKNTKQLLLHSSQFSNNSIKLAAQYYNRKVFLNQFSEGEFNLAGLEIIKKVEHKFGSINGLMINIASIANDLNTNDWLWVILGNDGDLGISTGNKYETPLQLHSPYNINFPLFGVDFTKNVYTEKFGENKRAYAESVINNLNWKYINNRYLRAQV